MKILLILLSTSSLLFASDWKNGEIEIVQSPEKVKEVQQSCEKRLLQKGYNQEEASEYSKIGTVYEDAYWFWIRDAVIFPSGASGTYNRIGLKNQGVVVFPLMEDKKVLLNVNFRHATRSWELELPRGGRYANESPEMAAFRELEEETGCRIGELTYLGSVAPDSGILASVVPIFMGKVESKDQSNPDESEAIEQNISLSLDELKTAFTKGFIIREIRGEKRVIFCRDGFLSYALLQAIWQELL